MIMNEYPETVEHEELDNASIGLEKATQILEEFRKRYPGIKDSEILNMVTALKNKRAREKPSKDTQALNRGRK